MGRLASCLHGKKRGFLNPSGGGKRVGEEGRGDGGGEKPRAAEGIVTQPVPKYRAADPGEQVPN